MWGRQVCQPELMLLSASDLHAINAFNGVAPVNVGKLTIDHELSESFGHQEEELAVKLVEGLRRHLCPCEVMCLSQKDDLNENVCDSCT